MKRHGFSLVELSFVIIIIMILAGITAGGGQYLADQAKGQKMNELAKEMYNAVSQYHARWRAVPRPASGNTSQLQTDLAPYISNKTSGQETTFADPWTGATKYLTTQEPPFAQSDYGNPSGTGTLGLPTAGRLFYFRCNYPCNSLTVRDQTNTYTFRYFAVQALDNKGLAVATYGK